MGHDRAPGALRSGVSLAAAAAAPVVVVAVAGWLWLRAPDPTAGDAPTSIDTPVLTLTPAPTLAGLSPEEAALAHHVLAEGRLARLPATAREVHVGRWTGLFTGEECLRFRLPPADVDAFVETSPSLTGVPATPAREPARAEFPWFDPTPSEGTVQYAVPPVDGHHGGVVLVDRRSGLVQVLLIWS